MIDVPAAIQAPTPAQRIWLLERFFMVTHPELRSQVGWQLNAMQRDIVATLTDREVTVKSRRAGLTTINVGVSMLDTVVKPGTKTELYAHNLNTAQMIFEQVVVPMYNSLPMDIRPKAQRHNVRELYFDEIDSIFLVDTVGQTLETAEAKGQGRTIHNLILTEFAFYRHAEAFLGKIESCVPKGGRIFLDSTPHGQNAFWRRFRNALLGESRWRARFYPWWWDVKNMLPLAPKERIRMRDAEALLGKGNPYWDKRHGPDKLLPEQIKWRRMKIADTPPKGHLSSEDRFYTEFPEDSETCFLTSGRPVILPKFLVPQCEEKGPEPGHEYRVGHDASTGSSGGHPCGTVVVDLTAGEVVYQKRDWCSVETQAERLIALHQQYNDAIVVVESNFPGDAVLALLRRDQMPGLYHYVDRELKKGAKSRRARKPGFPMTATTKPMVFAEIELAITSGDLVMPSGPVLEDLRGFQYSDTDTIEFDAPEEGERASHGDCGIALALAWQGRKVAAPGVG